MADCWGPKQSPLYYNAAMTVNRRELLQLLAFGPPIWEIVELYLRSRKTIKPSPLNLPRLI